MAAADVPDDRGRLGRGTDPAGRDLHGQLQDKQDALTNSGPAEGMSDHGRNEGKALTPKTI